VKNSINNSIDDLYQAFSTYEIKELQEVGCFDFGPTPDEIEGLSNELRCIPDRTIASMEFSGGGWDSWGSKSDVGYFLPRLMQYIAADVNRLVIPGIFSLFPFKLKDFFSESNIDWNAEEKSKLKNFMIILINERLSIDNDIGLLIELALILQLDLNFVIFSWKLNEQLYQSQLISLLSHFGCYEYGDKDLSGDSYFDSEKIQLLLTAMLDQLTTDEVSEVFSVF
jgi:hypothetical protein